MSWAVKEYYAEKNGKFYSFESIKQRNDAIKNHGMEKVPSSEIYKYRIQYQRIPLEHYDRMIDKL